MYVCIRSLVVRLALSLLLQASTPGPRITGGTRIQLSEVTFLYQTTAKLLRTIFYLLNSDYIKLHQTTTQTIWIKLHQTTTQAIFYLLKTDYCESIRQGCFHGSRTQVRGSKVGRRHRLSALRRQNPPGWRNQSIHYSCNRNMIFSNKTYHTSKQ